MIFYMLIISIISLYIFFIIYIYFLNKKIQKLENKIKNNFTKRNNLIPSLFESTKYSLNKHEYIFENIIKLRNNEYNQIEYKKDLDEMIFNESQIHNEFNFIIRICNTNNKLNENEKYLYIKELIYNISNDIWNNVWIYKKIVKKYNHIIDIKNITIIWLFIPINKIIEI